MRGFPLPARFPPVQSSLLVIILTQRTVLVCPPLNSGLGWHADKRSLSFPGLSHACDRLLLCLPSEVLTANVTIGRKPQTR